MKRLLCGEHPTTCVPARPTARAPSSTAKVSPMSEAFGRWNTFEIPLKLTVIRNRNRRGLG